MIDDIIKDAGKKMASAIDFTREDLATIRTGRAHPAMFNKLTAEYYGTPTPLQQLATFHAQDARTMLITPYDRSSLNAVERAIRDSDLGVNPSNDGVSIRIVMPELTQDRRKEYVKMARAKAEDGRVAIRNGRRHVMDQIKKLEKDKEVSEDEATRGEKALDAETRKHVEQVDELLKAKEAELNEV